MSFIFRVAILLALCLDATAQSKIDPRLETLGQTKAIPVLVLAGNDPFHRWKETTPVFRAMLEDTGRFDVRIVEDAFLLESEAALKRYKVIILNLQYPVSTPLMRKSLESYVKSGGGIVAVHWAIDGFPDWPEFVNLLGRRWDEGTSGERHGSFDIRIKNASHPASSGLIDFQTAPDEAIHFDLVGDAPIEVLADTYLKDLDRVVPVSYALKVGAGRVFFTSLGHSANSRRSAGFQQMIQRATFYAATGLGWQP